MLPTSAPGTYYYPSQAPATSGSYFPSAPIQRLETIRGDAGAEGAYHDRKLQQADEMVKARLYTNGKKDLQKSVNPLPPSGRIRMMDGIAVHVGTKQREPDWDIRYATVGAQPLQGGVMNSAQGRMYVRDRLKARVDELNAIQSGSFTPAEPTEKTSKKEIDAATVIYQLLLEINGYLIEGVIDQKVVDLANGVVGRLFSDGNTLSVSDVSRMMDITYRLERDLGAIEQSGYTGERGFRGATEVTASMRQQYPRLTQEEREVGAPIEATRTLPSRNFIFLLSRSLKRVLGVLTTLNKNIFATDEDKRLLLDALRPTMFAKEIEERPAVSDILEQGPGFQESYELSRGVLPSPGQEVTEASSAAARTLLTSPMRQRPAGRTPMSGQGMRKYSAKQCADDEASPSFFF